MFNSFGYRNYRNSSHNIRLINQLFFISFRNPHFPFAHSPFQFFGNCVTKEIMAFKVSFVLYKTTHNSIL